MCFYLSLRPFGWWISYLFDTGDNLISTPPLSGRHNKCGGRNYSGRFQIFRICTPQLSRHKHIPQFSSATIPFLDTKIHKDFPLENTHFWKFSACGGPNLKWPPQLFEQIPKFLNFVLYPSSSHNRICTSYFVPSSSKSADLSIDPYFVPPALRIWFVRMYPW